MYRTIYATVMIPYAPAQKLSLTLQEIFQLICHFNIYQFNININIPKMLNMLHLYDAPTCTVPYMCAVGEYVQFQENSVIFGVTMDILEWQ